MQEVESPIDKSLCLPDGVPIITPERKKTIVVTEGDRGGREYRSITRPLDLYVSQRRIDGKQYQAGNRFYSLRHYSILQARYTRMRFGDSPWEVDLESIALAPRDYMSATEAIKGEFERKTVFRVCCSEDYAGRRKNMAALLSGLDDLVRHFRY